MSKAMEKLYSHKKTYQIFKVLSEKVKQDLEINAETYDKNHMKLTINHEGNKGIKKFLYLSYWLCHKDKLPSLFVKCKDKLPDAPKILNLIENWDILDIIVDLLDIAGCLILDGKHLHAAPYGMCYILQLTGHSRFHVKSSSAKCLPTVTNISSNKLTPNENRIVCTEAAIICFQR